MLQLTTIFETQYPFLTNTPVYNMHGHKTRTVALIHSTSEELCTHCVLCYIVCCVLELRPIQVTWVNMPSKVWDEITYPFPNFNGCTAEVWERISNFSPHFIMRVITYPYWDQSYSMLVKGAIDEFTHITHVYFSVIVIDHDTVCAEVVGTATRQSMSVVPGSSTNHDSTERI